MEPVVALQCRADVKVCRGCIDWLSERAGGLQVTTTLPVIDMPASIATFEAMGFTVRSYDEGFAFVHFGEQSVFDLDRVDVDPTRNGAGCYITVPDVDEWHHRIVAAGIPASDIKDEEWGMREFSVRDRNGNNLRFGHGI